MLPSCSQTRAWQTIAVDLGPGRTVDKPVAIDHVEPTVRGIAELGLPAASAIRCLGLAEQIAQKLHACTAPFAVSRGRDILDILLIETLGVLDYAATAAAAQRVFEERATHIFPPTFTIPAAWRPEVERTAIELGFGEAAPAVIEARFRSLIQRLADGAVLTGRP